jgi:hypothetical protein
MTAKELKLDYFKFYDVENRCLVAGYIGAKGACRGKGIRANDGSS